MDKSWDGTWGPFILDPVIDKTNYVEVILSLVSWHPIYSGSLMNSIEKRIKYETQ
jgi:hypothetical protein